MKLGLVVLPTGTCGKIEAFDEGRTGGTAEPRPEGFDANSPGTSDLTKPNLILYSLLFRLTGRQERYLVDARSVDKNIFATGMPILTHF